MLPGSQNNIKQDIFFQKGDPQISPSHFYTDHLSIQVKKRQMAYYLQRFTGKLLLKEEIPLSQEICQQFLQNKWLIPKPSITQNIFKIKCHRCLNDQRDLFSEIDCQRCHKMHLYCRNCLQMGRVLACQKLYKLSNEIKYQWPRQIMPLTWLGELSFAQRKAADAIINTIKARNRLLIWAVTGSGKTEMLFPGITYALERGLRICLASPRADVIRELLPRIQLAFQGIHVQALYGGSKDNDGTAQLILATTHQLRRFQNAFDLMIIDEVDAFPYHQNAYLEKIAERARKQPSTMIYLTATPRLQDKKAIKQGRLKHVFVPVRYHLHPLIVPKWQQELFLKKRINQNKLPQSLIKSLERSQNKSRQVLIFAPTIKRAEQLYEIIKNKIWSSQLKAYFDELSFVHSKDPERMLKIQNFRQKKIKTLITTTILERGVTFPSVDVYVIDAGHQVFDNAALVQISGRAGRSPVDPKGQIVFIHDGLTQAIVDATNEIIEMNHLRLKLLKEMEQRQ